MFLNLLPESQTPPPRTRKDKMRDIDLVKAQGPIAWAYGTFLIGFLFIGLAIWLLPLIK